MVAQVAIGNRMLTIPEKLQVRKENLLREVSSKHNNDSSGVMLL